MSRIDKAIELAAEKKLEGRPPSDQQKTGQGRTQKHSLASAGYAGVKSLRVVNPLLVPLVDPNGSAAEQYKKLRSLLIRKTNLKPFNNTLLVTSSVPGEGKSLTVMNLALALARSADYSVVLVDTDLRNPQLHLMLNFKPEFGLVHYLRDGVPIEKVMHKVGLGNLCLIPAGEQVLDPLELLTSKRMQMLMGELKNRYHDRYVLLDTPPILPFADLRVLGEMVDHVLFVCRQGYSNLAHIEEGLDIMSEFNLLGLICNDATFPKNNDSSYYYGMK
ncbi:MAG: P-loop NTPase [Desulfuromonadales bacterium]|nr:P-loop NTPase [Desulfuromonadales bacterium]